MRGTRNSEKPSEPSFADWQAPELVAPAGDWTCARAAVENGADAVYFGLEGFNARMRAENLQERDLPEFMAFLHRRGVRGYLGFNTLVFPDELAEAKRMLETAIRSGVDAVIVQDVGVCRMVRELSPDFPIHASTQMTVTSAAGVAFARSLGCHRVVLARECPVSEIERIRKNLGNEQALPLEVFVHGALCVAYSGQCLTSEALGGRSANRGVCAQACRMPYELIADDLAVDLGDRRYLLSPADLAGIEMVPRLIRAGVHALKIEGRLKRPEYVASITRVYRTAIDRIVGQLKSGSAFHSEGAEPLANEQAATAEAKKIRVDTAYELEMAFSRGLFTGWMGGVDNQRLVHGRFGKKRGVYLGTVERVERGRVLVALRGPLKAGDGVVFDGGRPDEAEEGGRVYAIRPARSGGSNHPLSLLEFGHGKLDFRRIEPGHRIWKTSDPALEQQLRRSFTNDEPKFRRPLDFCVRGGLGAPLEVQATDHWGNSLALRSSMDLVPADRQPLDEARLRNQLGRLGGTPFQMGEFECRIEGRVILPLSELNRLRRDIVERLIEMRTASPRWTLHGDAGSAPDISAEENGDSRLNRVRIRRTDSQPQLTILVRNVGQLRAALEHEAAIVYCEFEDPKTYREAVSLYRGARGTPTPSEGGLFVAPPRIAKTGEEWILDQVRSSQPDGFLVRSFDHLTHFAGARLVGDYTLNVANRFTAERFLEKHRLECVTASYDLNQLQLIDLLESVPPEWLEITIHQHIPMFHMEHCVFCAFLSTGTDYRNCGRPCDDRDVRLRDRAGVEHPVKADAGCRNTVFNGIAQTGAEYVETFLERGARRLRVEFLNETPGEVAETICRYRELLKGKVSGRQLWKELRLMSQLGVTRGPLAPL